MAARTASATLGPPRRELRGSTAAARHLGRRARGVGEGPCPRRARRAHGPGGNRDRVVHGGANAGIGERAHEGVRFGVRTVNWWMDVMSRRSLLGQRERRALRELAVARDDLRRLAFQTCGCRASRAGTRPASSSGGSSSRARRARLLPRRAVIAEPPDGLGDVVTGRQHHAAVAAGAGSSSGRRRRAASTQTPAGRPA